VGSLIKTTISCQNGLLMIKKNIIIKNHQSLRNSIINRNRDLWLLMPEFPKRLWRPKLGEKSECKKNLKKCKKKLKLLWVRKESIKLPNLDKSEKCMIKKKEVLRIRKNTLLVKKKEESVEKILVMLSMSTLGLKKIKGLKRFENLSTLTENTKEEENSE